jgi:hypothetical protein
MEPHCCAENCGEYTSQGTKEPWYGMQGKRKVNRRKPPFVHQINESNNSNDPLAYQPHSLFNGQSFQLYGS